MVAAFDPTTFTPKALKPVGENETVLGVLSDSMYQFFCMVESKFQQAQEAQKAFQIKLAEHKLVHAREDNTPDGCRVFNSECGVDRKVVLDLRSEYLDMVKIFQATVNFDFGVRKGVNVAIREGNKVVFSLPEFNPAHPDFSLFSNAGFLAGLRTVFGSEADEIESILSEVFAPDRG